MTSLRWFSSRSIVRIMTFSEASIPASAPANWIVLPSRSYFARLLRTSCKVTGCSKRRSMIVPPVKSMPKLKPRTHIQIIPGIMTSSEIRNHILRCPAISNLGILLSPLLSPEHEARRTIEARIL